MWNIATPTSPIRNNQKNTGRNHKNGKTSSARILLPSNCFKMGASLDSNSFSSCTQIAAILLFLFTTFIHEFRERVTGSDWDPINNESQGCLSHMADSCAECGDEDVTTSWLAGTFTASSETVVFVVGGQIKIPYIPPSCSVSLKLVDTSWDSTYDPDTCEAIHTDTLPQKAQKINSFWCKPAQTPS